MRLIKIMSFLFLLVSTLNGFAQGYTNNIQPRVLILLDKSSSMINLWDGGRQKSKVANELILRLIDSIYVVNKDVEFSLRVFGHQYTVAENNCRDTRNEVPFRRDNRLQMEYRLDDIQPLGVTSIAYSLQEAAENDLVDVSRNAYSIILITDGGESCGGDICAVMRKLAASKVFFRPYIVSLEGAVGLKSTYDCMGDYLEVTKQNDIPKAVSKIVDAFRPMITITTKEYTKVKEVAAMTPTVLNVKIPEIKLKDTVKTVEKVVTVTPPPPPPPPVKVSRTVFAVSQVDMRVLLPIKTEQPKRQKIQYVTVPEYTANITEEEPVKPPTLEVNRATPKGVVMLTIPAPNPRKPKALVPPAFVPMLVDEVPERPAPQNIGKITVSSLRAANIQSPVAMNAKPTRVSAYVPVIIDEIPPRPAPVAINKLKPAPAKTIMILTVLDDGTVMLPRRLPPMPPLKLDIEPLPVAAKPKPKPVAGKVEAPIGKPAEYKVEVEDAKETIVEIYFTNGNGKFYATTPQVLLLEPGTGKLLKRFYRMVDADGNPDPQTNIAPGEYTLAFSETKSLTVNNVSVIENKRNKIIVKVNKASLSFQYANNIPRPVTEFAAKVIERNKTNGKIVDQPCTERLEYEPGNYHVIINTFPQDVRNLDLDFDEKVIKILQPGFAKFISEPEMTSVTLYQRLGDKFLSFHTMSLRDPEAQHLRIQPGEYQAHYHKGPGSARASEKVVVFIVKPTEETEVILN
jgi:hypothetical protein